MIFEALPIPHPAWKPAHAGRPPSPFSATYTDTREILDREIRALSAKEVRCQVVTAAGNTRGGNLRSDARVDHPGVIITIDTRKSGTLVYETDQFRGRGYTKEPGWHVNLRAIALGLEALRKVERYGIARAGQQYAGYRELGSGPIELGAPMTVEQAARLLFDAHPDAADRIDFDAARVQRGADLFFREAAKVHHPDVGGDPETFKRLVQARDLLKASAA